MTDFSAIFRYVAVFRCFPLYWSNCYRTAKQSWTALKLGNVSAKCFWLYSECSEDLYIAVFTSNNKDAGAINGIFSRSKQKLKNEV